MAQILFMEDGQIKPIESRQFLQEADLHDFLEKFPELIPFHEIEDDPPPIVVIGREVSVPSGSIDLLLVDYQGRMTIVETKLARNPEARREVVGQIIEYASFVSQWTADHIEKQANSYLHSKGKPDLYECLTDGLDTAEAADPDDFRDKVEENLRAGDIRLVIAVDELVESLRSTVTFLNSFTTFELLLLQLRDFPLDGSKRVFIPSLFGYQSQSKSQRQSKDWDEDSFFEHLNKSEPTVVEYTSDIYKRFKELTEEPLWGRGALSGSFNLVVYSALGRINVAAITSAGVLQVNFGSIAGRGLDSIVDQLASDLRQIDGVTLPADLSHKYPSIPRQVLTDQERRKTVLSAISAATNATKTVTAN